MKGFLVDTNIPSELTREKPDARVAAFLRSTDKNSIYLSVMTIGEICKGIATLPVSQRRTALQDWFDGKRQSRKHKLDERGILLTTDAERPRQLG